MKAAKFEKLPIKDVEKKEMDPPEGKAKKVVIENLEDLPAIGSMQYLTPYERIAQKIQIILDKRAQLQLYQKVENVIVNATPKPLHLPLEREDFSELTTRYSEAQMEDAELVSYRSGLSSIFKARSSKTVGFHVSLDDVVYGIGIERLLLEPRPSSSRFSVLTTNLKTSNSCLSLDTISKPRMKFIRIVLRKTELQLLYEQHGMTAIKNTEDGNFAEIDNKNYDYLTVGRGKVRRRSEAEAQTSHTLFKSRQVNTNELKTRSVHSYVSYFEMFDTFHKLECDEDEPKKLSISKSKTADEQFAIIAQLPSFHLASVIVKRLLAGNTFEAGQRRFRNMAKVSRTVDKISYKYSLKNLFTINPAYSGDERRAVADISFCFTNSDILAVAYGVYSYHAAKAPSSGEVCIWSIKNPCDPERFFHYSFPVVSVEFSPYMPTLLAIGLFDGSVEVRDVAYFNQPPLAVMKRTSSSGVDPVLDIKWIKETKESDSEIDPFIALSQDGTVKQFRIIRSPFLSCFTLMRLERLEGVPEGLRGIKPSTDVIHSNRSPQGLCLTKHPTQLDIYYILTDEGCIHKCSTNYQHRYIQALKTHDGSVNHMDFSPWSPKLFLTCGNDWCLRIWIDGIFEPLITLRNSCKPYNWAKWSRTHSTILIAINGSHCEIWDLRRNILKPMSATEFNASHNTMGIFSLDGNSILIGKERGDVLVNAIDELPFPPHYQYEALEKAIYKAASTNLDMLVELKSIGNFGYPNNGCVTSS